MAVGTYNYGVSVKSTYPGCESAIDEISGMEVHDLAGVEVSIEDAHDPCKGEVSLDPTNYHSGSSFVWYENGEELLGEQSNALSRTGLANGEYTYRVVVTAPAAQGGCVEEDEIVVNVYQFPDIISLSANPDVDQACEGGEITFTPNPPFALADFDYEWQQGGAPNGFTDASCTYTKDTEDLR